MNDRELMQQALDCLDRLVRVLQMNATSESYRVAAALRERLAQPDSCGHESCDCRAYCKKQQTAQQQGLQDLWHKAWPEAGAFVRASADDLTRFAQAVSSAPQPAPVQQEPVAWCPDVCPITGLPFFMWIEHHETGQKVPTYGGPYDSYTIPVRDKDGSYCRERYDHDLGGWCIDEVEDVGVQIVSDQAHFSDEPPASKPWVGLTEEDLSVCDEDGVLLARYWEDKLREKNNG